MIAAAGVMLVMCSRLILRLSISENDGKQKTTDRGTRNKEPNRQHRQHQARHRNKQAENKIKTEWACERERESWRERDRDRESKT